MTSAIESMVVDEKQLPEKPIDREKVYNITNNNTRKISIEDSYRFRKNYIFSF